MNIFSSIFLGLVQGLTEFLPVSSSGHLVIAQSLITGFEQSGVLFDVVLHLATTMSVLYFFRKRIMKMTINEGVVILFATVPAGIAGVFLDSIFEGLFSNVKFVGFALLVTGILNILIDKTKSGEKLPDIKNGFVVGIAQAFAIIPGISRSGSTIFTGSVLGFSKETAARFSFLLSVPAVLGATALQLYKYGFHDIANPVSYVAGFLAAFVAGVFSIKVVINLLYTSKFRYFGVYCLIIGFLVLLFI